MKKTIKILLILMITVVLIIFLGFYFINVKINEVFDIPQDNQPPVDLMVNEKLPDEVDKPLNIALFGIDCRSADYEGCRSDVMMIVSYKPKTNEMLVTSVVRDTYVEICDYGFDKINHAYAFGGPSLAVQTLNRSFGLDIEQYITVDFWAVEKIIDAVGGVDIQVSDEELGYLNSYLNELNQKSPDGHQEKQLTSSGTQLLNGRQAVAYMRIRYVGNGDFERMERQREVMEAALKKVNQLRITDMIKLVNELIPTVRTNFEKGKVIELLSQVIKKGVPEMKQYQIPTLEDGKGTMINGIYYYIPMPLIKNIKDYHSQLYPDLEYHPSEHVSKMNDVLNGMIN